MYVILLSERTHIHSIYMYMYIQIYTHTQLQFSPPPEGEKKTPDSRDDPATSPDHFEPDKSPPTCIHVCVCGGGGQGNEKEVRINSYSLQYKIE